MKLSKTQSLVILFVFLTLCTGVGILRAAIPVNTLRSTGGVMYGVFQDVNTTTLRQGAVVRIDALGNGVFTTINTGLGVTEVYLQNQNLRTTDSVVHNNVTASDSVNASRIFVDEYWLNVHTPVNITDTLGATPTFTNITLTGPFQ
jgi:hypothetical protein